MQPDAKAEGTRWLQQADEDLLTASRLVEMERHYAACFFSQQAAEKAAKAVLYCRGGKAVWGHSVAELWREVAAGDSALVKLQAVAAHLDTYYIPTRYPDALPGGVPAHAYDSESAERAISAATTIIETCRMLLRTSEDDRGK